jgi:hypothetical protein
MIVEVIAIQKRCQDLVDFSDDASSHEGARPRSWGAAARSHFPAAKGWCGMTSRAPQVSLVNRYVRVRTNLIGW